MRLRGVLTGALSLAGLHLLVANPNAYRGVGGLFGSTARLVSALMDPAKPGIPDLRRGAVEPEGKTRKKDSAGRTHHDGKTMAPKSGNRTRGGKTDANTALFDDPSNPILFT